MRFFRHNIAVIAVVCTGIALAGCSTSAVNAGIADAAAACNAVPSVTQAAHSIDSNVNAVDSIAEVATNVCAGVTQAQANESSVDAGVSLLDGLWESLFGTNTASATTSATPATPAATQ